MPSCAGSSLSLDNNMRGNLSSVAAVAALSVGLLACTSEPVAGPELVAAAPMSLVIPTGSFFGFSANNDGAEFWDNVSFDIIDDLSHCNVGFFAANNFGPCDNDVGTTVASAEFVGSQFHGTNGGSKPAPFTFGAGSYKVTFLGGMRDHVEEPAGWFTKSAGTYTLNPIAAAVSSQIGGEVIINSPGAPWGFYVTPLSPFTGGDGCGAASFCSDDTKLQQFALFQKTANLSLVGIEDQPGAGVGTNPDGAGGDRDYNDFFLRVEFQPPTTTLDGRMTGGGTADMEGSRQPLQVALTIHCDLTLSNNIQVNWGSNRWHLSKPITESMCAYVRDPAPPAAPINVFSGVALGQLNGVANSRLEFTFTDRAVEDVSKPGEPNGSNDSFSLKIYNPGSNTVALEVTGMLKTGNFQAHYDQPHK